MSSGHIRSDVIGRKGERKFDELCDDARLLSSTPQPDVTGKDRIVEFPFEVDDNSESLDNRSSILSCYVQIKTIGHAKRAVRLRLTAAERLVRDLNPTFIVTFILTEDGSAIARMNVAHVSNDIITHVLRRLRIESANGNKSIFNKFISIALDPANDVQIDPESFRQGLVQRIGLSSSGYMRQKEELLKTLGYDGPFHSMSATFSFESEDHFVDAWLGIADLHIENIEHFETRFGIAIKDQRYKSNTPYRTRIIPAAPKAGSITIQSSESEATIQGKIIFPVVPIEDGALLKFLFKSELIQVLFSSAGKIDFKFEWRSEDSKTHTVGTWLAHLRFLSLMRNEDSKIILRSENSPELSFEGEKSFMDADTTSLDQIDTTIDALSSIERFLNLTSLDDIPCDIDRTIDQSDSISAILALIDNRFNDVGRIILTEEGVEEYNNVESATFVLPVSLAERTVFIAIRASMVAGGSVGKRIWHSENVRFLTSKSSLEDTANEYLKFCEDIKRISGDRMFFAR